MRMGKTTIEWRDETVNPLRARLNFRVGHHCVKVSAGCTNCYASQLQARFGLPEFRVDQRRDVEVFFYGRVLDQVRARKKPTRYFWCDMSDLFGEWVPREWIKAVNGCFVDTPQHTHMILTKRAARMREEASLCPFPPNCWLGVSVEDQQTADERIPLLLQAPAVVRFVSAEPLLESVDMSRYLRRAFIAGETKPSTAIGGPPYAVARLSAGLSWVIVGGESGPKARPCNVAWIRSVKEQCQYAGVACFVKQVGSNPAPLQVEEGRVVERLWLTHPKGGDPAEWPEDLRVREFPR
jgi:protein gp37